MTDPTCARCGKPSPGADICTHCANHLARDLTRAADNAGELSLAVAKQVRIGDPTRGTGEHPLPFDWDAADARWAIANTLHTWARHISGERGQPVTGNVARWLAGQVEWLRHRPEAAEAFDELHDTCRLLERTIDRPAERWYAGHCGVDDCDEELHPIAGAEQHTCRACGITHDLAERKAFGLRQIEDTLAGAARCAHILSLLGVPANASTIRTWRERGLLASHGFDTNQHPLYRIGSVETLAREVQAQDRNRKLRAAIRQAERAEKRRTHTASAAA